MKPASLPRPDLLERGVHVAPYTERGRPVVIAVNSSGDQVAAVTIADPEHADHVVERVWQILDVVDPPTPMPAWPRLELVR